MFKPARNRGEDSRSGTLLELAIDAIAIFLSLPRFIGLRRCIAKVGRLRLLGTIGAVGAVYSPGTRRDGGHSPICKRTF